MAQSVLAPPPCFTGRNGETVVILAFPRVLFSSDCRNDQSQDGNHKCRPACLVFASPEFLMANHSSDAAHVLGSDELRKVSSTEFLDRRLAIVGHLAGIDAPPAFKCAAPPFLNAHPNSLCRTDLGY